MMTHSDAAAVGSATDAVASSSPSASPSSPPSDVVPPASSRALDHDDDSEAEAADVCPICLDADLEDGTMLTTSCGHRFCASCLRMASNRSPNCPLCRDFVHTCETLRPAACGLCRAGIQGAPTPAWRKTALRALCAARTSRPSRSS